MILTNYVPYNFWNKLQQDVFYMIGVLTLGKNAMFRIE